jgi:predicted RNase H-like nuclease (RuvC/YqgF family)
MSEDKKSVGDALQDETGGQPEASEQQKDSVSYDTHRKLLGEKKRVQDELSKLREEIEQFRMSEKSREENELRQKEEWKKLVEIRDSELNETKSQLEKMQSQFRDSRKLDAFLSALGGNVEAKYWGLVDVEKIVIDPESGKIDDMSVTSAVEDFRKEHGRLIDTPNAKHVLPTDSPKPIQVKHNDLSLKDKLNKLGSIMG